MRKLLISALGASLMFAANNTDLQTKIKNLEKELKELKSLAYSNQNKINPISANDHLFWSYQIRSSVDFIQYKLTNGDKKANNIFSNLVRLTGVAKPSDDLKATLQIEANNIYGMNGNFNALALGYDNSNWTANETPDDTTLRVSQAFFNYFFGDGKYMFSAGRRPAVTGYPAHFRAGEANPNSPVAHLVNMEFDGMSLEIKNDAFAEISDKFSDWGTKLKFCFGRGFTPNSGKFSQYPYDKDDNLKINDFAGFLFIPYDDEQYSVWIETIKAWNVKGYKFVDTNGDGQPDSANMTDVGNYFGINAIFKAAGVGDGINDFLDDTNAFISFALTQTDPNKNGMLGTTDSKVGTSIWVGADMPAGEDGRFGINYVHGTKYFRSMTYGEDTLIGSIAATRGNAYEVYYNGNIIPNLTYQLRATYIKYDYTGSNAFFGDFGAPMDVDDNPNAIKSAKDIRVYIKYNF
ncbi:MAG: DUF3373 domain-containing protein [Epsilonproteobacteria bacterium]|nr:DUF3373 domain-containing protein [Campylobacterota bacterium]